MMVITEFKTKEKKRFLWSVILWQLKLLQEGGRHCYIKLILIRDESETSLCMRNVEIRRVDSLEMEEYTKGDEQRGQ